MATRSCRRCPGSSSPRTPACGAARPASCCAANSRTGVAWCTRTRASPPTFPTRHAGRMRRMSSPAGIDRACSTVTPPSCACSPNACRPSCAAMTLCLPSPSLPSWSFTKRPLTTIPTGTCMSSSIRRCARQPSSSIPPAQSLAEARSSAIRSPRTLPRRCARRSSVSGESVSAFAPGGVNLIGEHTDYNHGLALPSAIAEGVTVHAKATGGERIRARALDCGEQDEFALAESKRAMGWRAYVRGVVAELGRAGHPLVGADLEIGGNLQQGAGLSSSAALEVALCLALLALAGEAGSDRVGLARLCSRVESEWVGAHNGMLDQLGSLYGAPGMAMRIDFQTFEVEPVPLR